MDHPLVGDALDQTGEHVSVWISGLNLHGARLDRPSRNITGSEETKGSLR
jgi:hypothetical protein